MDPFDVSHISFLDLSDLDGEEQIRVLHSLHSENSCVQLPWRVTTRRKSIHNNVGTVPATANISQPQVINHKISPIQPAPVYIANHVAYSPYQQQKHFAGPAVVPSTANMYPVAVSVAYQMPQAPGYVIYPTPITTFPAAFVPPPVLTLSPEPAIINNTMYTSPVEVLNETTVCEIEEVMVFPSLSQPEQHQEILHVNKSPAAPEPVSIPVVERNGSAPPSEPPPIKEHANAAAPVNKSWASLFNSRKSGNSPQNDNAVESDKLNEAVNETNNNNENRCPIKHPRNAQFVDPNCYRMGEYLLSYSVDGRTISLQPRGLINRSNYCYINSILQALLACPPVYNLLMGLSLQNTSNEKQKATPIIDGMCRFVKEFQHLPAGMRVNRRNEKNQKKDHSVSVDCDLPFEPSWIYKMLNGVRSDSFLVEGRQEDAEEFLGFLLNGLNDEMVEIMKLVKDDLAVKLEPSTNDQDSDKEWQVMGPKNKGGITRQTDFIKTPISDIFGGLLKSRIHRAGDQSTYNIQPFFTLQLNIEKVNTVREALEALVTKNQLEGLTSEKTKEQVEAWQQVTLDELPVILILHLKCFDFKLNGCTKILKALEFPIDLKLDSKLLSKTVSQKEKQYKLFAVVYHDGKEATKGHYVTDAFHVGYSSWLRYDDSSVKPVQEEHVLKPQGTRVPYLLFYRRSDTIRSK